MKLKVTSVPGCSFSNSSPSSVKLSFSEAAANTVTVPFSDEEDDEEQAVSPRAVRSARAAVPAVRRAERIMRRHSLTAAGVRGGRSPRALTS